MNGYSSIVVRAEEPDAVRRWASLEGKSASMSEDLYRRFAVGYKDRRNALGVVVLFAKLTVLLSVAWRLIGSG